MIKSPEDIPADAIPARVEFIEHCRSSLSLHSRLPYFADQRYCCTDCRQWFVWTAEEQRYWFEQREGSPYSTAARCQGCRRRRRGISRETAQKKK